MAYRQATSLPSRGGEWSFKKCVSRKILAKFQGSRRLEFFFDAFLESRFFCKAKKLSKGLELAEKISVLHLPFDTPPSGLCKQLLWSSHSQCKQEIWHLNLHVNFWWQYGLLWSLHVIGRHLNRSLCSILPNTRVCTDKCFFSEPLSGIFTKLICGDRSWQRKLLGTMLITWHGTKARIRKTCSDYDWGTMF